MPAAAQSVVASGSMGAGMFGPHPSTTLGVGVDIAGEDYAAGIGGRLQLLAGEGVRTEAWDEASEIATILRYAVAQHTFASDATIAAALGELGDVTLGNGTLVGGYASGLNLDHGHLGAEVRAATAKVRVEALIDDVVAPRIFGAETSFATSDSVRLSVQGALDIAAPSMTGPGVVGAFGAGAEISTPLFSERATATSYGEVAGMFGLGAGIVAGSVVTVAVAGEGEDAATVGARAEISAATAGYIGRYFGPLYERDRQIITAADGTRMGSQLDFARARRGGGLGGYGALFADVPTLGTARLAYNARPGLADQALVEVAAPYFERTQVALWAAADIHDAGISGLMMALEARSRIASRMFVSLTTARLLSDADGDGGGVAGTWLASVAVGAIMGE